MDWIFWYDWILFPVYFIFIYIFFTSWSKKHYSGEKLKYFKYGILAKLFGGISFAFYHGYIFKGGDTFLFFDTGIKITDYFFTDINRFFSLVFLPTNITEPIFPDYLDGIIRDESNFFSSRLTAVLGLITFKTYFPTVLIFSALSYLGIWYAFTSISRLFPYLQKELAFIFLFIPSIILWGSGLGKDSLTYGGICLVFGALIRISLFSKPKLFKNLVLFFVGASIVIIIKSYIIYPFLLAFAIGIIVQKYISIKSMSTKIILFPILLILSAGIIYFSFDIINSSENFKLDTIAEKVLYTGSFLSNAEKSGSTYDLGVDFKSLDGFASLLPVFPKSIITTLFRPYVWEIKSAVMLLNGLENLVLIWYFFTTLLKRRFFGIIPIMIKNPLIISCLIYTIIFAGLVGITSGNFGTLVRYKIPCIPFFCIFLVVLNKGKNKSIMPL